MSSVLIAITLIWLIAATITDIKKREVSDWLSFSLVSIALLSALLLSIIKNNYWIIAYSFISFVAFILIANIFYYSKLFGGGDAKLLIALGPILPQLSISKSILDLPLPVIFLLNCVFIGAIYGITYSLYLAIRNKRKFKEELAKLKFPMAPFIILALLVAAVSILIYPSLMIIAILVILFPPIFIFIKAVEKAGLVKTIETAKLTEGEWLANPVKIRVKGKDILITAKLGLTKKEIWMLKKYKESVVIKEGIPFVPVFLIAFILTFLVGNLFELLI
jgi:Flp pilus assembly protein protease CpaA